MRIVVLYGWICLAMAGCSLLPTGTFEDGKQTEKTPALKPVPPPQPVGYAQALTSREPYTGALPYVICFGPECNQPTPKSPVRRAAPAKPASDPRPAAAIQPVEAARPPAPVTIRETRIRESIAFQYNSTEVETGSAAVLERLVRQAKNAKEIWIKGFAGLTDTNLEREGSVMALALSRARAIETLMKKTGTAAHITVGAELVRCKSEDDCLDRFDHGGRKTDLEIVIIDGEKNGEPK